MTGEVTNSLTKERISSQLVHVPARGQSSDSGGRVRMLNRLPGLVAAKGE
ncbi:Lipoprotein OS=Streptomyces cyaneofuscatus OX=66883 GN=G3I52_05970 PE=4 SV=1 [Streptomyces cyaneofuscatus]